MKRRMKLGGVMVLAMLSLAAFAVASASASQPEFEGAPATFTGEQVGVGELSTFATITCGKGSSSGEVASATTVKKVKIIYKECKEPIFSTPCTSSGAASGEIKTEALSGKTAYLKAGSSEAGLVLKPESGTAFAKFSCTISGSHEVTGEVVCHATPINTSSTSGELTCKKSGSTQEPTSYLNPSGCGVLSGITLKDNGMTAADGSTTKITFSKALKLKSSSCV